jgi:hypothetical protein
MHAAMVCFSGGTFSGDLLEDNEHSSASFSRDRYGDYTTGSQAATKANRSRHKQRRSGREQ